MEKEVKCAWCEETMVPIASKNRNNTREIKTKKCSKCGNIISAYLDEGEEKILEKVRTFKD